MSEGTRGGEQRKETQKQQYEAEYDKLNSKERKDQKDEKRLAKLRERIKEDQTAPSHRNESDGDIDMGDVTEQSDIADSDNGPPAPTNENAPHKNNGPQANASPQNKSKTVNTGKEQKDGGVAIAYSRCNSWKGHARLVLQYGPDEEKMEEGEMPTCAIGSSQKHSEEVLRNLPLISCNNNSILDICDKGRRVYGLHNIEKILNVTTLEPNPNKRKRKPRPTKNGKIRRPFSTTLVKILWTNIDPSHQKLLTNRKHWNMRSRLMEKLKAAERRQLDDWIRITAKLQDESYERWRVRNGISEKRPPTYFPEPVQPVDLPQSRKKPNRKGSKIPPPKTTHEQATTLDSDGGQNMHPPQITKKRPRAGSNSIKETLDDAKKPKNSPKPMNGLIDRDSYISTAMSACGVTQELLDRDSDEYERKLKEIKDGWETYRQNMLEQGYKEL